MNHFKKYSILFSLLAIGIGGCKKYPEGPMISFRTKEQRIIGTWNIEKYLIDQVDSTYLKYPSCTIDFTANGHQVSAHLVSIDCDSSGGYWSLEDRKTQLTFSHFTKLTPIYLQSNMKWKIMKLKYEEVHLQANFNSKQYDIYLTRK